jgi:hypothetical protein
MRLIAQDDEHEVVVVAVAPHEREICAGVLSAAERTDGTLGAART